MYRFLLTPRWIAFHLLVVAGIVAMVNLGFWQLRRLDERREFNRVVVERSDEPVVALTELVPPGTVVGSDGAAAVDELQWRRVSVGGTYEAGQEVLVVNRTQGGEPGRNVVDVLRLDDGRALLVNRGFVPSLLDVPPPPEGRVELIGRLKTSDQRRIGQASDTATPGSALTEVRRIDLATLAPQVGLPVVPVYLELLSSRPAEPSPPYPIASPALTEGPHLSYAVQWFIFSFSVVVGWVLAVRHSLHERQGRPPRRRRPPPILDDPTW